MADQDYPTLYADLESSSTRARAAAIALEKSIGATAEETVPVNGYPDQPTLAKRVNDRIDEQIAAGLITSNALVDRRTGGSTELFDQPNAWPDHNYALLVAAANVVTPDGRFAKSTNAALTSVEVDGRPAARLSSSDSAEGTATYTQTLALLGLAVGDKFSVGVRLYSRQGSSQCRVLVRQLDSGGAEITAARQTFTLPATLPANVVASFPGVILVAGAVSVSILFGATTTTSSMTFGEVLLAKGSLADYRPNYKKTLDAAIAAAIVTFQPQITANTNSIALSRARTEGITELFANPNVFADKDYVKTVAAGGLDAAGGTGTYTKTANAVLASLTTADGRKGYSFASSSGTSSNRWLQTLTLLGLVPGDLFSASIRLLGGTSSGLTRILIRQFDAAAAEIVAARQTYTFTNGALTEGVIKFQGITVNALATSIDFYVDTNNTVAVLQFTDMLFAKGSVADFRPASKGFIATAADLAVVINTDTNREKWRFTNNVFPDPRFSNSGASFSWQTGAATPIVGKNGYSCIETPVSASASNRRSNKISVAGFKSGKISASLVIQEKIGDQGLTGLQIRLVAYNSVGAQLTWTPDGSDGTDHTYYVRYMPQADITSATTLIIADNVTLPTGTTDIAFDIRIQTTVQSYLTMISIREGADTSFKDGLGSSTVKTVVITPTGSDATGDGSSGSPFASLGAAITALGGRGTVLVRGAEFTKVLQFSPALVTDRIDIIGEFTGTANPIVRMSDKLTGITKTAGQTKIYQVTTAVVAATPNWIYQDGVADARTLIEAGRHQPEHNGRANRLPFTKIVKATATTLALAMAELDASADPRCFYDSGILYFTVDSGGDGTTANIYVDATVGLVSAGSVETAGQISITNLDIRYGGLNTRPFRKTRLDNVAVHGSRGDAWSHCGDSKAGMVETSCAGSTATDGTGDGVNGHNHANLVIESLYSHDNNDDGESNHEYGRTRIANHYCEYNGGTAVAPALGCDAIYSAGRSFRNQRISGRKPAAYCVVGAPADGGDKTLAIFRNCRSEEDTVSFSDGTPGTASYGFCDNCESINPTTTGYDVYQIRNCRHSGTGTPKTAKVLVVNSTIVA